MILSAEANSDILDLVLQGIRLFCTFSGCGSQMRLDRKVSSTGCKKKKKKQ